MGGAELPFIWALLTVTVMLETALQFVSWSKIEDELESRHRRARYSRYLDTARAMAALCALARVALSAALVALVLHDAGHVVGGTCASAALLVFAEFIGRPIGRKWSSGVLVAALPVLYYLAWPLRPVQVLGRRPVPGEDKEPEPEVVDAAREEIRVALEDGTHEGAIEKGEKEMIEGILKFGDVQVSEIMTPRTEMECLETHLPLDEAVRRLADYHHSRFPVYEDTLDSIVGVVYVRDLLAATQHEAAVTLRELMREPFLIPETKAVSSLLHDLRREHMQIAIVVDEYGGVSGLVTVEDIMEEIVGEIEDEYDEEDHENRIVVVPDGGLEVDGRVRIDELNEDFDMDIPETDDYDTVGGFVTSLFARMPRTGEQMQEEGLLVRVVKSDERRVRRVFLERLLEDKE